MVDNDIIVAPATAMGGAIAVIRMSGEGLSSVATRSSRVGHGLPMPLHIPCITVG